MPYFRILIVAAVLTMVSCGGGGERAGNETSAAGGVTLGDGGSGFSVPGAPAIGPTPNPVAVGSTAAAGAPTRGSAPVVSSGETPIGAPTVGDVNTGTPEDPSPTTAPPAGTPTQGALDQLLISMVPGGFVLQAEGESETGPVDLQKAADNDGADDAAAFFAQQGFVEGYEHDWYQGDGDTNEVTASLYRFQAAGGASASLDRILKMISAAPAPPGVHTETSPVAGVPGATMFTVSQDSFRSATVVFAHGAIFGAIVLTGDGSLDSGQLAQELARQQYARL